MFTETWHSKVTNLSLEGFEYISCPRPKFNKRAKRDSGGIVVYFKKSLSKHIEPVEVNSNGIIWFKLLKAVTFLDKDLYFCLCYIPPEDSQVYKNSRSALFQCDFYDILDNGIRKYCDFGHIFLTGDFNARTGEDLDFIPSAGLDRFVDLPFSVDNHLPGRMNCDKIVNTFGRKLLSLCKENSLFIVNGRLEKGEYTFHGTHRNRSINSTVDYLITSESDFQFVDNFRVIPLTEFSDHCPLNFELRTKVDYVISTDNQTCVDKIVWNSSKKEELLRYLNENCFLFDSLTERLLTNETDLNQCMTEFSQLVYDTSFAFCGKTVHTVSHEKPYKKQSPWFNHECKNAKSKFYTAKRNCLKNPTDENKHLF